MYKIGGGEKEANLSKSSWTIIAFLYLTLAFKFRKAFIKVVLPQLLLFHWYLEAPQDLLPSVIGRGITVVKV